LGPRALIKFVSFQTLSFLLSPILFRHVGFDSR